MIREHDRIVLTAPVPNERLEIGDVGTVVHVYADGEAFEIEFMTLDGQTAAVATVEASEFDPSPIGTFRIRGTCTVPDRSKQVMPPLADARLV